jgi:RNA polymerase sigma factor (sigma-70 family)
LNLIEEQYLLAQARQKNAAAAEKLIDAHYQDAYRFAYRFCQDRILAEDLTQEAFVRVWQHLASFKGFCRLKTWLFKIIYSLYIDTCRRQRNSPVALDENSESLPSTAPDLLESISLQKAWQRLPEEHQQILTLYFLEDLRYRQIAVVLQIPIGTVKSRLHSAVNNLRKHLNETTRP